MANRGILYIFWNDRNRKEAAHSIESLKPLGLPHHIVDLGNGPYDYKMKTRMLDESPYETTLFLDTDTVILDEDLTFGFEMAERHGIAMTIAPGCYARRFGLKGDLIEYNSGAMFFSKTPAVRQFFEKWKTLSEEYKYDQTSFAKAVDQTGFYPFVLPKNWNYRAEIEDGLVFGPIKIWHSRLPVTKAARRKELCFRRVTPLSYRFSSFLKGFIPDEIKKKFREIIGRFEGLLKIILAWLFQFSPEQVETPFGNFTAPRFGTEIDHLKKYGMHSRNELAMILDFIRTGNVVLDIGAHIGTYTIPFAKKAGSGGKVIAVEGLARNVKLLKLNVRANRCDRQVHCIHGVAGSSTKTYRARKNILNSGQTVFSPGKGMPGLILDHLAVSERLQKIDFIKIDVEGMEPDVLEGAREIISKQRPILSVEIKNDFWAPVPSGKSHMEKIGDFLKDLGYHFFINTGERNSSNDQYRMKRLESLEEGKRLSIMKGVFDLLAIHPSNPRYPKETK